MAKAPKQKPKYRIRIKEHMIVPARELRASPANYRKHPPEQEQAMRAVLDEIGYVDELKVVRERDGGLRIIDGHLRAGLDANDMVPVAVLDLKPAEADKMLASFDMITGMAEIDEGDWRALLGSLEATNEEFNDLLARWRGEGPDLGGAGGAGGLDPGAARLKLAERFIVPPFSVLDARQGYWQDRKAAWLALGIRSEVGRGENLLHMSDTALEPDPEKRARNKANAANVDPPGRGDPERTHERGRAARASADGREDPNAIMGQRKRGTSARAIHDVEWQATHLKRVQAPRASAPKDTASLDGGLVFGTTSHPYDGAQSGAAGYAGTSIFDPVLCELAYRWFSPPDAAILDPFAGGSVRGIVASHLGRSYTGIDLSAEQVAANGEQASIAGAGDIRWIPGDSRQIAELAPGDYDFVFSCPPYFDLERYTENPADISNVSWEDFLEAYGEIIRASCSMLRDDRFAAFVVGDVRDRKGNYRDLIGHTVRLFREAGLELYNHAILVTMLASLPIRVGRMFEAARKLGTTHQDVVVFVKGNAKKAVAALGKAEFGDPEILFGAPAAEPERSDDA